ncbi:hypothetical protein PHLCEN_2v839 [Hermanssonia centrifuga]|uniref:RING-type domain-containing protein n=1 Tax=Hermanssonia centrifuga TaxID=98765 RepID=A0A2R6S524_9APHY|nr:hypothetical protein PHLCEN_2v839 [Hermanssonia centrifuga]
MDQCAICYEDASTNLNSNDPINALTSLASSTYSATASSAPETTDGSDEEPVTYPIHTPYITDCDHTYCYVCITGRMMRSADEQSGVGPGGTRWECLRCGEAVSSADRVEVEVEEVDSESITFDDGYEFGSDMSGSVGDDSESYTSE